MNEINTNKLNSATVSTDGRVVPNVKYEQANFNMKPLTPFLLPLSPPT